MGGESEPSDPGMWSPGRIIATVVVAVLVATVGYMMLSSGRRIAAVPDVAIEGNPSVEAKNTLPDFTIPTIDGRTIKLSDYRGKVLVVRIAKENGLRGVEVVGLHIDDKGKSSQDQIKEFAKTYSIPYTVGLASDDMFIAYLGREEDTIPQTLVFGRDGKLVAHFIGYSKSDSRALDDAVNRAIGGA